MNRKRYVFLSVSVWLLAVGFIVIRDQSVIGACLDMGGTFDYAKFVCDLANSHPSQPYLLARLPVLAGITSALAVFFWLTFRLSGRALGWDR